MARVTDTPTVEVLREIRIRSGISQAELARRAGMPRSVINAYARGSRQPGADTLMRIVAAAGLQIQLAQAPDPVRAGRILEQVIGLAEALPGRRRGELEYPPLR